MVKACHTNRLHKEHVKLYSYFFQNFFFNAEYCTLGRRME